MTALRFTKDHEWVRLDGDLAVIGITDYAQSQLGDVVYVELPEPGHRVEQGKEAAVVELVKAASEVYAPVSGEVAEVNERARRRPGQSQRRPAGRRLVHEVAPRRPQAARRADGRGGLSALCRGAALDAVSAADPARPRRDAGPDRGSIDRRAVRRSARRGAARRACRPAAGNGRDRGRAHDRAAWRRATWRRVRRRFSSAAGPIATMSRPRSTI